MIVYLYKNKKSFFILLGVAELRLIKLSKL